MRLCYRNWNIVVYKGKFWTGYIFRDGRLLNTGVSIGTIAPYYIHKRFFLMYRHYFGHHLFADDASVLISNRNCNEFMNSFNMIISHIAK